MTKTKKQKVFDSLKNWLDTNNTMHVFILPAVVESDHPENKWTSEEVFEWAKEFVEDNPLYGKEGDIYKKYMPLNERRYSIQLNGIEVSGSKEQIIEISKLLNVHLHFSNNKNTFEKVEEMNSKHLLNVAKEFIETCNSPEEYVNYIQDNPVSKELIKRFCNYENIGTTS